MLKKIQLRIPVQWLVPLLVFLAAAALAAGLRELGRSRSDSPLLTLFIIALPVLAAAAAVYLVRIREERIHLDRRRDWLEKQLRGTMQLNHLLVNARHENELIEQSLPVFAGMTGAFAASFVPIDEWGQPLPVHTYGNLPAPVLRGWAEHLAATSASQQCRQCEARASIHSGPCPLRSNPLANPYDIHCFPAWRGERMIGMLNLYVQTGRVFQPEQRENIESLLQEMALAVEILRLRNQEVATLRNINLLRSPDSELSTLLERMITGVREAMGLDGVYLEVLPEGDRHPGLKLRSGGPVWSDSSEPEEICQRLYQDPVAAEQITSSRKMATLVAVPLRLPEGQVLGAMLGGTRLPGPLGPRQMALLYTVATQAAFLVEAERSRQTLELRITLQERSRLAREIHDSLAQTLAFLKLNARQMQSQLDRRDYEKLRKSLEESYITLSEAYIEARQAIEQLRLEPDQKESSWLEQLCTDFESVSGLVVERDFEWETSEISPEIQVQLMRVVQEALNNVRKHAKASRVRVACLRRRDELLLEIEDDGQGFSVYEVPLPSRHGLRGMQERAELIGADIQVESKPGKGTLVRLRLPVQLKEVAS
ncbi:MAG TPA: GAF domain-containing sensor histidine kinase [Chloroflexi bacterium]|nr:GAF domain-containing sensor histidine kinase [Chloroflexota bacterium]